MRGRKRQRKKNLRKSYLQIQKTHEEMMVGRSIMLDAVRRVLSTPPGERYVVPNFGPHLAELLSLDDYPRELIQQYAERSINPDYYVTVPLTPNFIKTES